MSDGWRARVARFAVRRAAACQRDAPLRADWWLSLGASWAPTFGESHTALVHLRRLRDDRWGAVEAARTAASRFPDNPDAWMLLGEACQMAYRQADALGAFEEALALEERSDAALAAGELYRRAGRHREAAARFARAYAAGAGPDALLQNARSLHQAGDVGAAEEALKLWATLVPNGLDRLPQMRAELHG